MGRSRLQLRDLQVRAFRGIDELHLTFPGEGPGGLCVIAGDNGTGKTSVLEAILLVLGQVRLLSEDAASLREQVRFGARDFLLEAVVVAGSEPREFLLAAGSETFAQPTKEVFLWGGGVRTEPATPFWERVRTLSPSVEYFSARREPEGLGDNPSPRGPRSEREGRRLAELKRRLKNTFYRSLRGLHDGGSRDPFGRLNTFIGRFIGSQWALDVLPNSDDPSQEEEVVVRDGPVPADISSLAMARLQAPERRDVPTIVPIDRLSSGQISLLCFAGPLVFRDEPADFVIIDEPEQHLHPRWQRTVLHALRELTPESQLIVATHSIEILESALSWERIQLVADRDPRGPAHRATGG